MARERFASSAPAKPAAKNAKPTPDSRIDFSGIPESTAAELKRARRVGRPKTATPNSSSPSASLPASSPNSAAKQSKPYQTLIHELLEKAASKRVA